MPNGNHMVARWVSPRRARVVELWKQRGSGWRYYSSGWPAFGSGYIGNDWTSDADALAAFAKIKPELAELVQEFPAPAGR